MTAGHKHHSIRVKRDGLVHRLLTKPVIKTRDLPRVEASKYPYGVILNGEILETVSPVPDPNEVYYLSTLSILHGLFGLTLNIGRSK